MELRKSTRIGWGKRKELTGFRVVSVDREIAKMEPEAVTFEAENVNLPRKKSNSSINAFERD